VGKASDPESTIVRFWALQKEKINKRKKWNKEEGENDKKTEKCKGRGDKK
jgi:hypothetical protein